MQAQFVGFVLDDVARPATRFVEALLRFALCSVCLPGRAVASFAHVSRLRLLCSVLAVVVLSMGLWCGRLVG